MSTYQNFKDAMLLVQLSEESFCLAIKKATEILPRDISVPEDKIFFVPDVSALDYKFSDNFKMYSFSQVEDETLDEKLYDLYTVNICYIQDFMYLLRNPDKTLYRVEYNAFRLITFETLLEDLKDKQVTFNKFTYLVNTDIWVDKDEIPGSYLFKPNDNMSWRLIDAFIGESFDPPAGFVLKPIAKEDIYLFRYAYDHNLPVYNKHGDAFNANSFCEAYTGNGKDFTIITKPHTLTIKRIVEESLIPDIEAALDDILKIYPYNDMEENAEMVDGIESYIQTKNETNDLFDFPKSVFNVSTLANHWKLSTNEGNILRALSSEEESRDPEKIFMKSLELLIASEKPIYDILGDVVAVLEKYKAHGYK